MSKIIKLTTIVVFLFVFSNSFAQDKTIDSLKIVLRNPKLHDTSRLFIISNVMEKYGNGDELKYLNNLIKEIASKNIKKSNSIELQNKCKRYLGMYYSNIGRDIALQENSNQILTYLDKSISLFKSAGDYVDMNFTLISKGICLSKINENEKAISCCFSALKYFEKENNQDLVVYALSNIATIYLNQKEYEKAILYNKKGIAFFEPKKTKTVEENYRISDAYNNCGTCYFYLKKYDEAIDCFNKSLALYKIVVDNNYIAITLTKMARVKTEQGKYDESLQLLKEAAKGEINELATTCINLRLGELYYKKKELAKAETYLSKGFELSKIVKNIQLQTQASELLYKVSKENYNFKKALEIYEFQVKLNDSSKIEASKNALAQQQLKYDFEKKELNLKLNAEKKNALKNNWLIALSAALLLLLLGGYFYYRNNKQKQAIAAFEKNQIKQKLLITQMNPHFIFNSIDNIQSLIYNKQDKEAVNYLTKFSKLTRQILENSTENYISLSEEIEMIENYLIIQQLLHNNKFDFKIDVEKTIDVETILLPPMLTQPFIENAIKHGLNSKTESGKVDISFYLKDDKLFFNVSDNGTGFDASKKVENHKSLAMTITKERLINYTKNQDFIVQTDNIIDEDGNSIGAKVIFEIPYIYEK